MLSSITGAETGGIASIALQSDGAAGALAGAFLFIFLIAGAVSLVLIASQWKVFTKAGQPGWASIVPIYNVYVLVSEIAGRDDLWVVLSIFVPFAIVVPLIDVAEKFGKGTGYGLGLYFLAPIFWPMLGFGDAQYQG